MGIGGFEAADHFDLVALLVLPCIHPYSGKWALHDVSTGQKRFPEHNGAVVI
jgi:hypothetical protein